MTTKHSQAERTEFYQAHPEKFAGQLWERCRCGAEPVNMPSHLCIDCLIDGRDRPRIQTATYHSTEPGQQD